MLLDQKGDTLDIDAAASSDMYLVRCSRATSLARASPGLTAAQRACLRRSSCSAPCSSRTLTDVIVHAGQAERRPTAGLPEDA